MCNSCMRWYVLCKAENLLYDDNSNDWPVKRIVCFHFDNVQLVSLVVMTLVSCCLSFLSCIGTCCLIVWFGEVGIYLGSLLFSLVDTA